MHDRNCVHGYLAHKKQPPPLDHHTTLGIVLLQGPNTGCFGFVSEVPLYMIGSEWGRHQYERATREK